MALLRGLTRPAIANRKRCAHLLVSADLWGQSKEQHATDLPLLEKEAAFAEKVSKREKEESMRKRRNRWLA